MAKVKQQAKTEIDRIISLLSISDSFPAKEYEVPGGSIDFFPDWKSWHYENPSAGIPTQFSHFVEQNEHKNKNIYPVFNLDILEILAPPVIIQEYYHFIVRVDTSIYYPFKEQVRVIVTKTKHPIMTTMVTNLNKMNKIALIHLFNCHQIHYNHLVKHYIDQEITEINYFSI